MKESVLLQLEVSLPGSKISQVLCISLGKNLLCKQQVVGIIVNGMYFALGNSLVYCLQADVLRRLAETVKIVLATYEKMIVLQQQ